MMGYGTERKTIWNYHIFEFHEQEIQIQIKTHISVAAMYNITMNYLHSLIFIKLAEGQEVLYPIIYNPSKIGRINHENVCYVSITII